MRRRNGGTRWRGGHARAKFKTAFTTPYRKPAWLTDLEILHGEHDGPHPIAEAFVNRGTVVKIKVLKDDRAKKEFGNHYPYHDCVLVAVGPHDTLERVRDVTFAALKEHCGISA